MPDRERQPGESSLVFFEPLNFIGDSAGTRRVDILYRVSYDFFVFVRDTTSNAPYPFIGHGDLVVDLIDSAGNSISRKIVHIQLGIITPRMGMSDKIYSQGILSFQLLPGTYKLVTELNDKESTRRYFNDQRLLKVRDLTTSHLNTSDILFADAVDVKGESASLLPLNFGGDVPFGVNFDGYIEIASSLQPDSITLWYSLKKISVQEHHEQIIRQDTIGGQSLITTEKLVMENGEKGSTYRLTKSGSPGKLGARLFFKGDSLDEGDYDLRVMYKEAGYKDSLDKKFRIRWFDMPLSLRNPEIVLRVMEYVMNDSEYAAYKKAGHNDRSAKFKEFWKHRDPTPGTAYNEALAEYFRRVDYVTSAFSTLNEFDGYRMDRGKAYIVYGPPDKTERELTANSVPKEIWYYPSLHKLITFIDHSHKGEYRLISIDKY